MSHVPEDVEEFVCSACIGERILKEDVVRHGTSRTCSFCAREGQTLPIEAIADRMGAALEQHFRR